MESNIDELPIIMGNHVHKGIRYPNSVLPSTIDAMETFEVRPDDIFVNTYPKSGMSEAPTAHETNSSWTTTSRPTDNRISRPMRPTAYSLKKIEWSLTWLLWRVKM